MEKRLEYSLSMHDWARHGYEEALVRGDVKSRSRYYYVSVFPVLSFMFGAIAAFMTVGLGGSPLFLIVGLLLTGATLRGFFDFKPYSRAIEDTFFPRNTDRTPETVRLAFSREGLMECQGLITLSVPWSEVLSSSATEDYLVIRLRGLRRVLVPKCSQGFGELNLEEVRQEVNRYRKAASNFISESNNAGQSSAGQPATRSQSKLEGGDQPQPQPEAEDRSR